MADKKYFWLRLKRDFFKRHDIQIVESMPDGKEYILFYLKLLCESIDHEGKLRFSDEIPYSEDMLAAITNTDKQIVCDALRTFEDFGMIENLWDGTIYLKQVDAMIGQAEQDDHTRESTRLRVKAYRERQKQGNTDETLQERYSNVTCNGELEKEIEKEKYSIEEKRKRFVPPTLDDVKAYCRERNNTVDPQKFFDYYEQGGWKDSKGNPVKNWKQKLITWENKQPKTELKKSWQGATRSNIDFEELKKRCVVN